MKILSTLILTLFASAISLAASNSKWFLEDRSYTYELFPTPEACLGAREESGRFFNCSQDVSFFKNGQVTLMMTDIMDVGTYEILGSQVIISFKNPSDAPSRMVFQMDSTRQQLTLEGPNTKWRLLGKEEEEEMGK